MSMTHSKDFKKNHVCVQSAREESYEYMCGKDKNRGSDTSLESQNHTLIEQLRARRENDKICLWGKTSNTWRAQIKLTEGGAEHELECARVGDSVGQGKLRV